MLHTTITHEIKTPLNAIILTTQQLCHTSLTSKQAKLLQINLVSAKQMLCLVNDITDLFQIQNGTFKIKLIPVNLKIAINDLYNIVSLQAAEKKIAIDIIINKQIENEIFFLDGMRISSILQNLVMNAIKFSPEGGKIQIKA